MAWTKNGTVSVTNGSAVIYGAGTTWASDKVTRAGDTFKAPDGRDYEVLSVQSNTQLTLTAPYLGVTASAQSYALIHTGLLPAELAVAISDLQSKYLATVSQLYEWETTTAETVPLTNPATGVTVQVKTIAAMISLIGSPSDFARTLLDDADAAAARATLGAAASDSVQKSAQIVADAGGTADAITASYTPAISTLADGMTLYVRAASANTIAAPTFTPASGTIVDKAIVKGAGTALAAGDIAGVGHWIGLQYDATTDKWVLLNPASGFMRGSRTFLASASFTVPAGVFTVFLTGCGGGGGGAAYSSETQGGAGGGGAASCIKFAAAVVPGKTYAVTIGAAGGGSQQVGGVGGGGGTTSFGSLLSLLGGAGGRSGGGGGGGGSISGTGFGVCVTGISGDQYNPLVQNQRQGGAGGGSIFGQGGRGGGGGPDNYSGGLASGFGAGGGGASLAGGGAGSPGFLIVEW